MTLERLSLARSGVDRAAHLRTDEAALAALWSTAHVLVVADGKALVRDVSSAGVPGATEAADGTPALVLLDSARAPTGERYFLGLDPAGAAYFAVAATELPPGPGRPAGLREVGALLDDRDAGLLAHAVALANWHDAHACCARCGSATSVAGGGHLRRCERDGSEHYPRTDPAVIMAVIDADDRVLLGRQAHWPVGRFSTLAGFVEPGESLEQAVAREVMEEVGVRVGRCHYLGSQPWPFPSSLMLGFLARAETTRLVVDGTEIAEAAWFSRGGLAEALRSGRLLLPPPVSIARRLIEHWYGGRLGQEATW